VGDQCWGAGRRQCLLAPGEGRESSLVTRMGLGAPGVKRVVGRAQSVKVTAWIGNPVPQVGETEHWCGHCSTDLAQGQTGACSRWAWWRRSNFSCGPGGCGMTPWAGLGSGALTGMQVPCGWQWPAVGRGRRYLGRSQHPVGRCLGSGGAWQPGGVGAAGPPCPARGFGSRRAALSSSSP